MLNEDNMKKILVQYSNREGTTFNKCYREFHDEESAMTFINQKVIAGFVCHRYNHLDSFKSSTEIVKFTPK